MTGIEREEVVGVVGLGQMGRALATRLVTAGFDVVAYDVRPEAVEALVTRGATAATGIADLVSRVRVVSIVVLDDEQLEAVVGEILETARAGTAILVHSTVVPSTAVALARLARERGVDLVDAPISGGAEKALRGLLTVMVGGDDDAVRRCRPILEALGQRVFHVGPAGAGEAVKLANNSMTLGTYALALEVMQLARSYGIDEDAATAVITSSQGDSRLVRTWGRMDRNRREHVEVLGVETALVDLTKDLRQALRAANEHGLNTPMIAAATGLLPGKMIERDRELAAHPRAEIPLCAACGMELASPYRQSGTHPECTTAPAGEAQR